MLYFIFSLFSFFSLFLSFFSLSLKNSCVPVIVSNEFIWPFSPPLSDALDPSTFSLSMKHSEVVEDINNLPSLLFGISEENYQKLHQNVLDTVSNFSYWSFPTYSPSSNPLVDEIIPDGGAIDNIMNELTKRKREGITKRWEACKKERKKVTIRNKRNDCNS